MSTDVEVLERYVEVWKASATDVSALLRSLTPAEWDRPTELPGWNVRAVAAHLGHLESELAGIKQAEVEVAPAAHITGAMGEFTERGPIARQDWSTEEIVSEFGQAVAIRYEKLLSDPPTDPAALAPGFAGLIGWSWKTLLSNRVVDLWMHEQDIRRATGHPGGLTAAGAAHTAEVFAGSLPFILGKRLGAGAGTSLVLEITGAVESTYAVEIGEDGRGRVLATAPAEPTVRLQLDFADWIALAGGRVTRDQVSAQVEGDSDLGERALKTMAVTP